MISIQSNQAGFQRRDGMRSIYDDDHDRNIDLFFLLIDKSVRTSIHTYTH